MVTVTYQARAGFYTGNWTEINSTYGSYGWGAIGQAFTWLDLMAGPVPDEDVFTVEASRRLGTLRDAFEIGQCDVLMDNSRGQYSVGTNKAQVNHRFTVKALTSTTSLYSIFAGHVERVSADPSKEEGSMALACGDTARKLRQTISTSLMTGIGASSMATIILDTANVSTDDRVIDQINGEVYPVAFLDNITAGGALSQIQQAGNHYLFTDGRGRVVVRDRNYDVIPLIVGSYEAFDGFIPGESEDSVINIARITYRPRTFSTDVRTIAWIDDPIFVAAQDTVTFTVEYFDPATGERGVPAGDIQTPIQGEDWKLTAGEFSDISSQAALSFVQYARTAEVTITNSGASNGYLSVFQLKGTVASAPPDQISINVASPSVLLYGESPIGIESDLIAGKSFADAYADHLTGRYRLPDQTVNFGLTNVYPECALLDLSNIVTLVNSVCGVGSSFIIASVQHSLDFELGAVHRVGYEGFLASDKSWYFILDHDTRGRLDVSRLGF